MSEQVFVGLYAPIGSLCGAGGAAIFGYAGDRVGAFVNHWFFD
jgi:hypothetical protein